MTREQRIKEYENDNKYTSTEVECIVDLEMIADELDEALYEKISKDYSNFIKIIKNIQDQDINEKIKSYAEYIFGALLPLNVEEIKDEVYTYDGFEDIITATCWINLIEKNPNISTIKFIKSETNLIIAEFIKNSKHTWALATGIAHCYYIKDFVKNNPNEKLKRKFNKFKIKNDS